LHTLDNIIIFIILRVSLKKLSKNNKILTKINDLIGLDRDSIIKECGYEINKQLDYVNFYANLLDALGLNDADRNLDYLYQRLVKNRYVASPILDENNIIYCR
jgi:hypothetical protein